jgi:membrane protein DedA with SNARE-associated domain
MGAPVPGTTALIAAALYASSGHNLPILGVITAGAGGAVVGTCAGFALGRWGGEPLLLRAGRRLRHGPERIARVRAELSARGGVLLFIARFISGLRNVAGLLAGAGGMPVRRFVPICVASAVVWATLNGLEYYWFGRALAGASAWLQILLVCAGIGWTAVTLGFVRRRALDRIGGPRSAGQPK